MKKKLYKNIFLDMYRNKIQIFVLFSLIFFATLFLSMCIYLKYDKEDENEIASSLKLNIEINEERIFSREYEDLGETRKLNYDHYMIFYNWINEVGNNEYFSSYNYIIGYPFEIKINETDIRAHIYGIQNYDYFQEYNRTLIEGNYFDKMDILNSSSNAIVSDDFADMNDSVEIKENYNENEYSKLNIIGVIEKNETYLEYDLISDLGKKNGIFLSNNYVHKMIQSNSIYLDYSELTINEIYFKVKDYNEYEQAKNYLKSSLVKLKTELNNIEEIDSNLLVVNSNEENLLKSFSYVNYVYQIVFIICFIIVIGLLFSILYYLLNKRKQEIIIYNALGLSKINMFLLYYLKTLIVSIFSMPLGIYVGLKLSLLFSKLTIISDSNKISLLMQYTSNINVVLNKASNININIGELFGVCLIMLFILTIIHLFIVNNILINIKNKRN